MLPNDEPSGDEVAYRQKFYRETGKTPEEEDRGRQGNLVSVFVVWGVVVLGLIVYYW